MELTMDLRLVMPADSELRFSVRKVISQWFCVLSLQRFSHLTRSVFQQYVQHFADVREDCSL